MLKRITLAAIAATLLALGLTAMAQATAPGKNGLIAFSSDRDGNAEIYTATRTGLTVKRLTDNAASDTHPAFSPDGTRIAFTSDRDGGDREIYVMDADGSNQTRITTHVGDDMDPAWSPDGTRLAIRRNNGGDNEIFLIDAADGGNAVNLTANAASDFEPEFSPDASKIVFQRYTAGSGVGFGNEVMLMDADGTNQINLTDNANTNNDGRPSFAPGGNRIAFDSNRNDGRFEIYTMALDGSDVTRLTDSAEAKQNPAYSPAGDLVAFNAGGIGLVSSTGGAATPVTTDADLTPDWSTDSKAPTTELTGGPAEGSIATSGDASITFTADEAEATFECRLDSTEPADWASCGSPKDLTALTDGSHTFEVRATDLGGNVEATPIARTWTVDTADTVAPVVTIESTPVAEADEKVHSVRATFGFSADEADVDFECRLDSTEPAGWAACESPKEYTGLADGNHTFEVRATDTAGNTGAAATHSWEVLTVKPIASITAGPAGLINISAAGFEFTSDLASATFECRVDAVGADNWAVCPSPVNLSGLTEGDHIFELRATDLDQGTGPIVTHEWTVDTVAPVVTVDSGPEGVVASQDASIGFTVDDAAASVECRFDSADESDWAVCASPKELTGLADGEHMLELRATDAAGNVGTVSRSWTVDTVAPVVTIDSSPIAGVDGKVHSVRANFEFSAVDQTTVTFECRLDSTEAADWADCDSPKEYAGLADGNHDFEVRGADGAGNVSDVATHTWEIATDKPVVSISNGPADPTADDSASFDLDIDPVSGVDYSEATFECRLDSSESSDWAACTSPVTFDDLSDGEHTVEVRAIDPDQGVGSASSATWQVDTIDPTVELTGTPAPISGTADPEFTFVADDATATTAECRLDSTDDNDWIACSSPATYTGLSETGHTFEVRVTDAVGHTSAPVGYTWIVETTPPVATITSDAPESPTTFIKQTFTFEKDNPNAYFECSLDDAAWSACESPVTHDQLSDAQHTFKVRAVGHGAGPGPEAVQTWTVDTVVPTLRLTSGPDAVTTLTDASFEFEMNKPGFTFRCTLDGGGPEACDSPQEYPGLAAGDHTFTVEALDSNGAVIDETRSEWTVLAAAPAITVDQQPPAISASATAVFRFSSNVSAAGFECRIDGGSWESCASPTAFTDLADGSHTFQLRSKLNHDPAGSPQDVTWQVDTTAPDVRIAGGPNGTVTNDTATFNVITDDATATTECRLDNGAWAACDGEVTFSSLVDGDHQLRVRSVDAAGNTGNDQRSWSVDRSQPVTTITEAPDGSTVERTASFDFSVNEAGVTFQCRLDGGAWQNCSPVVTFKELELGQHSFEVRATDRHGNAGDPVSHSWTVVRPPFKGLKPTVKISRKVKLNRDGDALIARINCPEGPCRVTAPKRVRIKVKGRTVRPGIKVVRTSFNGSTTANLVGSPAIRKLVARRGPGKTKVRITVRSENGKRSTTTVTVKLTAK